MRERLGAQEAANQARDLIAPGRFGDMVTSVGNQSNLFNIGAQIFEIYAETPENVLADGAKLASAANIASQDLADANIRVAVAKGSRPTTGLSNSLLNGQTFASADEHNQALGKAFLNNRSAAIREQARNSNITAALLTRLAYAIAKQLDDGGRLSDKDIELAWAMLGGDNRDERISADAISAIMNTSLETILIARDFAEGLGNSPQGTILNRAIARFDAAQETFITNRDRVVSLNQLPSDIAPNRAIPQSSSQNSFNLVGG